MDGKRLAELVAVLACVIWGFLGFFIRELHAAGLTSLQISGLRFLISSLLLLITALATDARALLIKKKDIPTVLFYALVVVIYGTVYNEAVGRLPLSIATILEMTSPLFVIVFSFVLFKEIPAKLKILSVFIAIAGGVLVTGLEEISSGTVDGIGILMGLLAGMFLGLSSIGIKTVSDRGYNIVAILFWTFFIASLFAIPISGPVETAKIMFERWENVALILGLVILMTALPFGMQAWSITKISVSTVSILSISQCIFAGLFGYFYYGETLTAVNLIGIAVLVSALVLLEISDIREKKTEEALEFKFEKK